MEIKHKKNTAYYLAWPMVDSSTPASFKTGLSPTDTAYYTDGAGAWASLAITDTAAEIGSTGVYEIDLTAAELNHDKVLIKFTASGAADTAFLFDMTARDIDDVAYPSTSGRSIEVETDGMIHADVKEWLAAAVTLSGGNLPDVNVGEISDDATAADNAELAFDGTGYGFTGCTIPTVTTLTGHTAQSGDTYGALPSNFSSMGIEADGHVHGDLKEWLGTAPLALASQYVQADTVKIETVDATDAINAACDAALSDYDAVVPADLPANFGDLAITVTTGKVTVGTNDDKTGYSLAADQSGVTIGTVNTLTGHTAQTADHTANIAAILADTGTDGVVLAPDAVTAAKIGDDAFSSEHFATGCLTADAFAANAFVAATFAADYLAAIESEVNDALDTAISELGVAAPAATPTIRTALMLMYMALRNKLVVQTSGTDALEVYNDAGTLICKKLLTDDGSDYTEAEMTSG